MTESCAVWVLWTESDRMSSWSTAAPRVTWDTRSWHGERCHVKLWCCMNVSRELLVQCKLGVRSGFDLHGRSDVWLVEGHCKCELRLLAKACHQKEKDMWAELVPM